jgi:hypothetical protein
VENGDAELVAETSDQGHSEEQDTHTPRWLREARRRVEDTLAESRQWQAIKLYKTDFWETF